MTIVESLERHRDACISCQSAGMCAVARELIDRLAERLVPQIAPEIVDFADPGPGDAEESLRILFAAAEDSQKVGKT